MKINSLQRFYHPKCPPCLKENKEEFNNFYSNKKGQPSQSVNAEIGDTQSARITEELASADKGSENISNSQE
jgi:hypothetical protein